MRKYQSVDDYLTQAATFQAEQIRLREILLSTGLDESLKWSLPCYSFNGSNVVAICGFKAHFGLWFFQGALIKDTANVLINAKEGRTQAMLQWRMAKKKDIQPRLIKAYVQQAVENAAAGKAIKPNRNQPLVVPPELTAALNGAPRAQVEFDRFTKSKQREFANYISDAKRAETKMKRIEKILPMILAGVGLNDQYR